VYKNLPHKEEKIISLHNIQEANIVEDMCRNIPRIYVAIEGRQAEHRSHMIEVEGKIINQPISILIESREIHSSIDPKVVERLHFMKIKLEISWLVQLTFKFN
jgi:hypothetical protein